MDISGSALASGSPLLEVCTLVVYPTGPRRQAPQQTSRTAKAAESQLGSVVLPVPAQNKTSGHPRSAWITPAKERIATAIARKHGLFVCEPPDSPPAFFPSEAWETHRHLRLSNRKETIVIAYPEFLKIRLYATGTNLDLHLAPELLKDLAALYKED
jgi:hypothetical protein